MSKLTCPSCGCTGDEELFGADLEWRMAMNETLAMPSNCAEGVKHYLRLFRPQQRNLTPKKARRLLAEIRELICADEITFDRATYHIPAHVWEQALTIMADKQDLQRPIANHNYLIKVAIGLMARRTDIDQQERHQVRRSETRTESKGMQPMSAVIAETVQSSLPQLPAEERSDRMDKARELMLEEGFKPAFLSDALVEQRAREIYAEEVTS